MSGPDGTTDPRDDLALIDAINDGDHHAFESLYLRYRQWTANLAYRLVGDRSIAQDATQETWIYVLQKFPGFTLTCQFKSFLYPVVRHTAIRLAKKRRQLNPQQSLVDADLPQTTGNMTQAPTDPDAAADQARADLAAALIDLSEEHREVVLLRFVDDLSMQEIAEAMAIPVGTVKSRLHHALRTLRESPATRNYFAQ